MTHHCHAIGCSRDVPPRLLMCAPHWRSVPGNLQRLIWRTYRAGQEVTKDPSAVYLLAQAHVVAYVAARVDRVWDADRAADHVADLFRRLGHEGRLTVGDLELLAAYDPESFGSTCDAMRDRLS